MKHGQKIIKFEISKETNLVPKFVYALEHEKINKVRKTEMLNALIQSPVGVYCGKA
jgi:lipoate-protein ligase B